MQSRQNDVIIAVFSCFLLVFVCKKRYIYEDAGADAAELPGSGLQNH